MLRLRPADQVRHRAPRPADRGDVRALVVQHRHRHPPAVVLPAQQVPRGHAHVLEEHLVEVVAVGDVRHRLHRHPRRVHVQDEGADAAMLLRLLVRPRQHDHLVRQVRVRGPDLLPLDHVVVAVAHRPRLQRGEVAARLRLAEPLAVPGRARGHLRQQPRLLLVRPVHQHRRPRDADREQPPPRGRAMPRQLLVQHHLLERRRPHPPVLPRPRRGQPRALPQLPHELPGEGRLLLVVEEVVVPLEVLGDLRAQELDQLLAPRLRLVRQVKFHGAGSLRRAPVSRWRPAPVPSKASARWA